MHTYHDIEQHIIKLGEMLGNKSKEEVQEFMNLLTKEIGYNSFSGKAKYHIKVITNDTD